MKQNFYRDSSLDKREIDLVICHVLGINTAGLMIYQKPLARNQELQITKLLQQRENGKPLAYIIGEKDFWNLSLKVNQHTLIPRPETEQIVELILEMTTKDFCGNILDLGTGTGAIALSIANERPNAQVAALDFSIECIKIAEENKLRNSINNVTLIQSNWFEEVQGNFDFIVSNPPYIREGDEHLSELKYEPISALTAKNNGLADIETIVIQAPKYLNTGGVLMMEHGYDQGETVRALLQKKNYHRINTIHDLADIPRITLGYLC